MASETNIYESFFDNIPPNVDLLFFVFDMKTQRILFLSDSFNEVWGSEKSLYIKKPELILDTIVEDDKKYLIQKYKNILDGKDEKIFEFKIRTSNDKKKWISLKLYKTVDPESLTNRIFGFGEDITLKKDYELNLLNINERKNNVLQIIGHDLRGPLENLKTFTNLLEKEYEQKSFKDFGTYIQFMRQTCENSMNLIGELLTLEFILSDQIELKLSRIELLTRFKIIFETYLLADKNLKKNFILDSSKDKVFIEVDELKFMLIFSNLISNAYKFTRDNGTIKVKVEDDDKKVKIIVEDDGIGIPKKLHPFIFEKFSKARRPGIQGEKPVGLGLHIIKYMVELHKGKIWFESQENVGTKFFVEIPKELPSEHA